MIIKVCGMREPENLRDVEMLDVDCLGFIFYDKSPRYVPENREYIEVISHCEKNKVGVFVNETIEKMLYICNLFRLNFLQLHGNEPPEVCFALREKGYVVIKSFSIAPAADFTHSLAQTSNLQQSAAPAACMLQTECYQNCCDYFLFDTTYVGYGGSGKRFDWSLLDGYQGDTPFLLSGGLTPDNAADIKRFKHPQFAGIDLNSGFELYPAMKDVCKLKQFIRKVRQD